MAGIALPGLGAAGAAAGDVGKSLGDVARLMGVIGKYAKDTLGPALAGIANILRDALAPVLKDLAERLSFVGNVIRYTVLNSVERLGEALGGFAAKLPSVSALAARAWDRLVFEIKGGIDWVLDGADAFAEKFPGITDALLSTVDVIRFTVGNSVERIGEVFKPLGDRLFRAAETYLKPATARIGTMIGRLFDSETLKSATRGLAGGAVSLVGAAAGATQAVIGLGQQMGRLVGLANPAALMMFQNALDDLQAVIGQALTPVFELITKVVRMAADTLTTFAGVIGGALGTVLGPVVDVLGVLFEVVGRIGQMLGKVMESAAPALAGLGAAFVAVLRAVQPVLDLVVNLVGGALAGAMGVLAGVVEAVVPYVTAFATAVGSLIKWLVDGIRDLMAWLGFDIADKAGTKAGSSVGAAVKGASIGSVESVLQKAQTSAYSLGTAADPAKTTATAVTSMADATKRITQQIEELPGKIWAYVKSIPGMIADALNPFGDDDKPTISVEGLKNLIMGPAAGDYANVSRDLKAGPGVVGGGDF